MENWLDLNNKVVVVTGGNSGIGKNICTNFRNMGARAISVDISSTEDSDSVQCDVTDIVNIKEAVEEILDQYGKIDVLINNAGINLPRLLVDFKSPHSAYEFTESDFDTLISVNVKGTFFMTQEVIRQMKKNITIINISSEAGMEGSVGQSIYSATKGAINSLTRSWAKELGHNNIRVVAIAPGVNESTAMNSNTEYQEALAYTRGKKTNAVNENYYDAIPLGRAGKLDEISDLVCYLASSRASYITGTVINITGGKSRR